MGRIPTKKGKCIDCPPGTEDRYIMANRCITDSFHYQRHQQKKFIDKISFKTHSVTLHPDKLPEKKKRVTGNSTLSTPKLLINAQTVFNAYIRFKDSQGDYFVCISCKEPKSLDQMNAGHFYSAGNHSYLRFNENNVHGQCIKCNCHLHGNLIPYRINLVKKIGLQEVEKLDTWCNFSQKWDKVQLLAMIQMYRSKLIELQQLRASKISIYG